MSINECECNNVNNCDDVNYIDYSDSEVSENSVNECDLDVQDINILFYEPKNCKERVDRFKYILKISNKLPEQRSYEWFQQRKGCLTASEIHDVLYCKNMETNKEVTKMIRSKRVNLNLVSTINLKSTTVEGVPESATEFTNANSKDATSGTTINLPKDTTSVLPESVPKDTTYVLPESVPKDTTSVLLKTESVPKDTIPVLLKTESVPKDATPVLLKTESVITTTVVTTTTTPVDASVDTPTFSDNKYTRWGERYEHTSVQIFEQMYNVKIHEAPLLIKGCIGASCDGILTVPKGTKMKECVFEDTDAECIEIKNPYSRDISWNT
jgi:hypothetical protein